MLYLCVSRFNLKVHKSEEFRKFFTTNKTDVLVEEKDETPDDVDIDEISDTEEQDDISGDLIDVDSDSLDGDDDDAAATAAPQLPSIHTQQRTSGRKRLRVEDDMYERY